MRKKIKLKNNKNEMKRMPTISVSFCALSVVVTTLLSECALAGSSLGVKEIRYNDMGDASPLSGKLVLLVYDGLNVKKKKGITSNIP